MSPKRVFISTVVVLATLLGAYLAVRLISIIILLAIAFIFASAVAPLVSRLNRRLGLGASIALVYLGLALVLGLLFAVIAQPLVAQTTELIQNAPQVLEQVQSQITAIQRRLNLPATTLTPDLQGSFGELLRRAPALAAGVLNVTLGFVTGIASALLVLVMAFYWLLERRNVEGTWLTFVPAQHRGRARSIMQETEEKAGGYVRGVTTLALLLALLSYIVLKVIGIPFALVLALIAGLAEFVPLAGPFIAAVPAILIGLSVSPTTALVVTIAYIVIQQIENNLLVPKVMQRSVGLSPLTVLVAVLAGAALLGVVGALLSVPVASAIQIVLKHTLLRPEDNPQDAASLPQPRGVAVEPRMAPRDA